MKRLVRASVLRSPSTHSLAVQHRHITTRLLANVLIGKRDHLEQGPLCSLILFHTTSFKVILKHYDIVIRDSRAYGIYHSLDFRGSDGELGGASLRSYL